MKSVFNTVVETSCSRPETPFGALLMVVEGSGGPGAGTWRTLSFSALAACAAESDAVFRLSVLAEVLSFTASTFVTDCLSLSIVLSCVRIEGKRKEGGKMCSDLEVTD